jgi:hypothetical protein
LCIYTLAGIDKSDKIKNSRALILIDLSTNDSTGVNGNKHELHCSILKLPTEPNQIDYLPKRDFQQFNILRKIFITFSNVETIFK